MQNSRLCLNKKLRPTLGEAGRREPGLGTGRGGDVTGSAYFVGVAQRDEAVAGAARGSPSETQTFGSDCDWRFTKRYPVSDQSKMSLV